jgi:NTE family protein
MLRTPILLLMLLAGVFTPTGAMAGADAAPPKVALILAGGGAKGVAHVGVLKVLEEAGIRPDMVVGTSMGAVIGGLYASGMTPDRIERVVDGLDWTALLQDDPSRTDMTARRRAEDRDFLADVRLRVGEEGARLPVGLVKGQNMMLALRELLRPAQSVRDFDQLPIRFRAVAADIETGDEVVLGSGDIVTALRASMAVPGAFPPVRIGGRLLVDGGLVNNVPISEARDMGADIVIVASFTSNLSEGDKLDSALTVLNQAVDVMIARASRRQLESLTPQDVLISIDLGDIDSTAFDRVRETIPLGVAAARDRLSGLEALATRLGRADGDPAIARASPAGQPVTGIRIIHRTDLDKGVLLARMRTRPGDPVDDERLREDMARLYGLGLFDTVTYRLEESPGGYDVVVNARSTAEGADYFRFGFDLANDFEGRSAYTFTASYTDTAINSLNGEWRAEAVLGETVAVAAELYQPLDPGARFFARAFGYVGDRQARLVADGEELARARVTELRAGAEAGTNLTDALALAVGIEEGWGRQRERTGTGLVPRESFGIGRLYARLAYDSFDSLAFPRRGILASARYDWSAAGLGADRPYHSAEAAFNAAHSWGRNTVILTAEGAFSWGGRPGIGDLFTLGEPFRLTGYLNGGLAGAEMVLGRALYYRELARFGPSFLHFPLYAGGSVEVGNVFDRVSDIEAGALLWGGSLFVAMDTPLGPLFLGYGYSEHGEHAVFLSLGGLF